MTKKNNKYTQLHILYVSNYQSAVQTIVVKETKKLWTDMMHTLYFKFSEKFAEDRYSFFHLGSLKKEEAYKIIHNKYWIMMYGPDFNKLVQTWNSKFNLGECPRVGTDIMFKEIVDQLNNNEIAM